MSFEEQVKQWVSTDNQMKLYSGRVKELRSQRNDIAHNLLTYVENKNLGGSIVQISDGKLKFQHTKITNPLTFRFVEECLHGCIQDENQVKYIIQYIKSKRSCRMVPDIKRVYNKTN
jgi:hypothetical protein